MTNKFSSVSIFVLASLLASGAYAADIHGKSMKDDPIFGERVSSTSRSGIYINGSLGIANIDRSISQTTTRENGDVTDAVLDDPTTPANEAKAAIFEADDISSLINGSGGDVDSTVYGGGVSYLFHMPASRLGLEIGVEGTGYAGGDSGHSFEDKQANFTTYNGNPVPADDPRLTGFTSDGSASVDRKFDIDLVAKAHLFINDRWSVYAGGGLSWAHADICASSNNTLAIYNNKGCSDDSAFGYVLIAGTQLWLTDRITLGAEYSYKQHDFDANVATLRTGVDSAPFDYTKADDKVEVEDETHTIKAKIGFKLN